MHRTTDGQRGSVMLVVVIVVLLLGMVCFSLVVMTAANSTAAHNSVRRAVALTAAEIGVERAKEGISNGLLSQMFPYMNDQAVDIGEVTAADGETYGGYRIHVTNRYGGVDNQYLVIAQGSSGTTTRQVRVVLRRDPAVIPDFLAAITLYNPNALARFCGTPPNVCGLDTDLPPGISWGSVKASDCVPGSGDGPDAIGVGVHDDQSVVDILDALGKKDNRVWGTDGSGGSEESSVYNITDENPTGHVDTMTAQDIIDLADQYAELAHYSYDGQTWCNGQGQPDESGNFGTVAAPKVVIIRSSEDRELVLSGCLAGVGVLIIDCDVRFAGTFNYAGLVVITRRGEATVDVEMMGTPLVMGAMIAANPLDEATSILDLRGTADVFYSRDALAYATQALSEGGKFETLFYTEEDPDEDDVTIQF